MKENSISERWKEDTDGEQDLCRASGRYLTIMLTICLQGGKWDLTAASGSNRCSSTRTCARVGAICSPSDGSVIKAQLWGAARATQLEPQLITEDWQRRWARGQRWQTRLSDFVLFTLPLVNQKMNFILDCMAWSVRSVSKQRPWSATASFDSWQQQRRSTTRWRVTLFWKIIAHDLSILWNNNRESGGLDIEKLYTSKWGRRGFGLRLNLIQQNNVIL